MNPFFLEIDENSYQRICIKHFLSYRKGDSALFLEKGLESPLDIVSKEDKESFLSQLVLGLNENFKDFFEKNFKSPGFRLNGGLLGKDKVEIEVFEKELGGGF